MRTTADMFDHPQVLSQGIIAEMSHPKLGTYKGKDAIVERVAGAE